MLTTVNNSAQLVSALTSAKSGDTIALNAGSYANFSLSNLNFSAGVTITSASPAAQAVLNGFTITNSSGLNFQNLTFSTENATIDNPYRITSSSNLTFDHLNVHGSMDNNDQNDRPAFLIRTSNNVSVTNSEFQQLQDGISHLDSKNLNFSGNNFHDIREDGIHGGGSSNVTISDNYFHDFHSLSTDHPDAVQFWTTNTTASAQNITVTNNVVSRGSGDLIQGVFMRDDVGGMPFQHVTVSGNVVVGGMYNGIMVQNAVDVKITDNVVAGLADATSWIRVEDDDQVVMSGNRSTAYILARNTNITETDATIAAPTDGGKALAAQLLSGVLGGHTFVSSVADTAMKAGLITTGVQAASAIEATRMQVVTINGTSGADRLTVDMSHNTVLNGGDGADTLISGGIGHNVLNGGGGDDTYVVTSQYDTVVEAAGGGNDSVVSSIDYALPANVENLRLTGDADSAIGNSLDNRLIGAGNNDDIQGGGGADTIQGMDGNDRLSGGDGADVIYGNVGNDTVTGDAGDDKLFGNEGNDSLSGGDGADTLEGGAGADTLSGGGGADIFQFRDGDVGVGAAADRIVDFSAAQGDKISLSLMDANALKAGDQAFTFIGASAFHGIAGELRDVVDAGGSHLMGDVNGDGVADFDIYVVGAGLLKTTDIWL